MREISWIKLPFGFVIGLPVFVVFFLLAMLLGIGDSLLAAFGNDTAMGRGAWEAGKAILIALTMKKTLDDRQETDLLRLPKQR